MTTHNTSMGSGIFLSRPASMKSMPALIPGTTIVGGRYLVIDVIGMGGTRVVYRAYDTVMKQDVAIKASVKNVAHASVQQLYKAFHSVVGRLVNESINTRLEGGPNEPVQ